MRSKLPIAFAMLTVLVVALGGCSKHDLGVEPKVQWKGIGTVAKPDTTPKPPPPPGDTTFVPVEFVSADSTPAGGTGNSRWLLRGPKKPFTTTWTLTADPSWPGFPIQGTARLTPNKIFPLTVPFSVPASAFSGIYYLQMEVTTPDGSYATLGQVRVFGNDTIPPPPPPPAVMFQFSDSVAAGTSGNTYWQVTNESSHAFTMDWTLSAKSAWPGYPIQGSVALGPNASQQLIVSVPVPDSAAAGVRGIEMLVTRPDSLPPASSPGYILVH